jgi:hypothetical protein
MTAQAQDGMELSEAGKISMNGARGRLCTVSRQEGGNWFRLKLAREEVSSRN